jgi:hypothetical protein
MVSVCKWALKNSLTAWVYRKESRAVPERDPPIKEITFDPFHSQLI